MPNYMTTEEVAALVRQPSETVRYWRHVGKGPKGFKVGRRVLYDQAEVLAWLEAAKAGEPIAS
jgi:excisionase family DNA binding protein